MAPSQKTWQFDINCLEVCKTKPLLGWQTDKSADLVQPTKVFALEPKMEMRLINMNIAPRCISDEARKEEFIKLRFLIYPGFLL